MTGSEPPKLLTRTTEVGIAFAGLAVLAMMLLGAADVVGMLFGAPVAGAIELIESLMVLVVFLALPAAELNKQHISVDLAYRHFPLRLKRFASASSAVLSFLFYGAMAWQGWKLFWHSWKIREYAPGAVAFPIYPSKALFALGVTMVAVVIAVDCLRKLKKGRLSCN